MEQRRWLAGAAAIAFAGVTAVVGASQGAPLTFLVLDTATGLIFIGAGLVAWHRRPEVATGRLLVAAGALWFVGSYGATAIPPLASLGNALASYYDVLLAYLVLSFPGGSLSAAYRAAIGAILAGFLVRTAARLFVLDLPTLFPEFCAECPPNPFVIIPSRPLLEVMELAGNASITVGALAVIALAVGRWNGAQPGARRVLRPLLAAGMVAMLAAGMDAAETAGSIVGVRIPEYPPPLGEIVGWAPFVARTLIPIGFLIGTLRLHMAGGPLATLAAGLGTAPPGIELETAVRTALGDTSARVLTYEPQLGGWIDSSGTAAELPSEDSRRAITILGSEDSPRAAIVHDPILREDPSLVSAVSGVLLLAVDNERLTTEVRRQLAEVRASRSRIVDAADSARKRIERDLHDGAQQRLVAVALALQDARAEAARAGASPEILERLDATAEELRAAVHELRELARGIHPAILTDEGLAPALATLVRRAPLDVRLEIELKDRESAAIESTAYYIVAEALANVARHAAASHASVSVQKQDGALRVEVSDDGRGGASTAGQGGTGLRGLADRVAAVNGTVDVVSPPAGGTRVTAVLPCE